VATWSVRCVVSPAHRLLSAKLHSAGHLLDAAVRNAVGALASATPPLSLSLVPGKGYHFRDGPWVEYDGAVPADAVPRFTVLVQQYMEALVAAGEVTSVVAVPNTAAGLAAVGLPADACAHLPSGRTVRVVTVGGAGNACPCGGTHVGGAADLAGITVSKVTSKKGKTKVAYAMA